MSDLKLDFYACIFYRGEANITFPILASVNPNEFYEIDVKLDTGSTFCVFQRHYADILGIAVERGTPQRIRAATGSFLTYGHEVTLSIEGIEWQATVFFAEDEFFPVSVVGRIGFLDHLRIGLVEYEQILFLAPYEDA